MKPHNLEGKIQLAGDVVDMLRNGPAGVWQFPMRSEFSNWRDEQTAWSTTAAMFDQSHHMTEVYFQGPDAVRLMADLGVNTFTNFARGRAKQFVACNYDGYVIGDGILFGLEDDEVVLVGPPLASRWAQFHAESGDYDVTVTRDEVTPVNPSRRNFRFQLQGPNSLQVIEAALGGPLPEIKPFHIGEFELAGCKVRALNHSMSGKSGLEIWGARQHGPTVWSELLEAGQAYGLLEAGGVSYSTTALESGWFGLQIPAIYSGEQMRPYREWLANDSFESIGSLGGSYRTHNIEDYYVTPYEIGYGGLVKFDHDFIGREALEKMKPEAQRKKVWLRWNSDDVAALFAASLFGDARPKFMSQPYAVYSTWPSDSVEVDGRHVGISARTGYTTNAGAWFSLATIEPDSAVDGTEVTVVWGEENGGTRKPAVERHVQTKVRAVVSTKPLA